jgi:transposase
MACIRHFLGGVRLCGFLLRGFRGHVGLCRLGVLALMKGHDSDRLDRELAGRYGIEMIAPHRGERETPTQDGRSLRRYRRRWRVQRLLAWLDHFRRLVIRWEYHVENFFGMVRLGCMKVLLKYFKNLPSGRSRPGGLTVLLERR